MASEEGGRDRRLITATLGPRQFIMNSYEQCFSDAAILRRICRKRVKEAAQRHQQLQLSWTGCPIQLSTLKTAEFLPPRRALSPYRIRSRQALSSSQILELTYYQAAQALRRQIPEPEWAQRLNQVIHQIQGHVFGGEPYHMDPPQIVPMAKDPHRHRYRPLAIYSFVDNLINGMTAAYLIRHLDGVFDQSSLAFRLPQQNGLDGRSLALQRILQFQQKYQDQILWCGEVDIQSFFDCVAHEIAQAALKSAIARANAQHPNQPIDPRCLRVVDAYLDSYSFCRNVKMESEPILRRRHAEAEYRWPEADLRELYGSTIPGRLGIPQGGALSNVITNCVLDMADQKVRSIGTQEDLLYLRFCDDILILSPNRHTAQAALAVYCETLKELKLPIHRLQTFHTYDRQFWAAKSRAVYGWGKERHQGQAPWISYLGYQIRYDGTLRIRPATVARHIEKLVASADYLLKALGFPSSHQRDRSLMERKWKKSPGAILSWLRRKLIRIGTGSTKPDKMKNGQTSRGWTYAFKGLLGQRVIPQSVKLLDRCRERQLARVARRLGLTRRPFPNQEGKSKSPLLDTYKYSYFSHLTKKIRVDHAVPRPESHKEG